MILRPVDLDDDAPRLATLINTVEPEPITAETLRERERRRPAGQRRWRVAAVDHSGWIAGFADSLHDPWMPPGRFSLSVVVDPAVRNRGIGTLLYGNALRWAQEQGATSLESEVRDNCPACLRFAQQRGFAVDRHIFESVLDLSAFDAERFAGVVEAAEASGIHFFTLADLGNTLEAQRMLYELNRRTARDNPSNDDTFAPFEEFRRFVFSASWYRADGQIVAAEGDQWVGMAAVGYFRETNSMYNMFTGVDRAYRGRKLALALKLLAIRCAQRYGATYLRTNNDSQNAPMLAINRKLGYQPQVGKYRVIQELARRA